MAHRTPVLLRRFIRVRAITDADVTELHSEILSVFDATDIITPDQLRGNASSLKEALIDKGGRCAELPCSKASISSLVHAVARLSGPRRGSS